MRALKRLGWIFGSIVVAGLLVWLLAGFVFAEDIKNRFISELNKQLATPVHVDTKDIHFSLVRDFPYASLSFENIAIEESLPNTDSNFLQLDRLAMLFGLRNLVSQQYTVRRIDCEGGRIHLHTRKDGIINYRFWKTTEDSAQAKDFSISLSEIRFKDVLLTYDDQQLKQYAKLRLEEGTSTGDFTLNTTELSVDGAVYAHSIDLQGQNLIRQKPMTINGRLTVELDQNSYTLNDLLVGLSGNEFLTSGKFTGGSSPALDIAFSGEDIELAELLSLLPGLTSTDISEIRSNGKLKFDGTAQGSLAAGQTPSVKVDFSLAQGSVSHRKTGLDLRKLSFRGDYKSNKDSEVLGLFDFNASQSGERITLDMMLRDFANPYIDVKADGRLALGAFLPFLTELGLEDPEGYLDLTGLAVRGRLNNLSSGSAGTTAQGTVGLNGIAFKRNGFQISLPGGKIRLDGSLWKIEQLFLESPGNNFALDGQLDNVWNWISGIGGNLRSSATPQISGKLIGSRFDLGEMMEWLSNPVDSTKPVKLRPRMKQRERRSYFLPKLYGGLETEMENFVFGELDLRDLKVDLAFNPGKIQLKNAEASGMSGSMDMKGSLVQSPNGQFTLELEGEVAELAMNEVFTSFEEFGQTVITSKNLKGTLDGDIKKVTAHWNRHLDFKQDELFVLADLVIEEGELIGFKPIEAMSSHIDINDLRHIKFSRLSNSIRIDDSKVHLPVTDIRSSAMDLQLAGTHDFNNNVDYLIKVRLAEVLEKKFFKKKKNRNEDFYEREKTGGLNLYMSMTGNAYTPEVKINSRESKKLFKQLGGLPTSLPARPEGFGSASGSASGSGTSGGSSSEIAREKSNPGHTGGTNKPVSRLPDSESLFSRDAGKSGSASASEGPSGKQPRKSESFETEEEPDFIDWEEDDDGG